MTQAAGRGSNPAAEREAPLVLIVEDDPDTAELIARCLGEVGYQTLRAADGEQAISISSGRRISLVLLDWRLPGHLCGRPLLQRLRTEHGAPVVVISADPASLTEASDAGAADYLPKPFRLTDLVHVVDEHCR
ncbi:MAG: response regulator [Myxococcales bacterium]|nr:response regulator [Myxococcales bacterium]